MHLLDNRNEQVKIRKLDNEESFTLRICLVCIGYLLLFFKKAIAKQNTGFHQKHKNSKID